MGQVTRSLQTLGNRVFNRVGRQEIAKSLLDLGLSPGDTVYARVSMSSLGYVPGGPGEVVGAVFDVVGQEGTLVLAAWPFADPSRPPPEAAFDVTASPSRCGLLSEALRNLPEARRSLHPIASVAAIGVRAAEITASHDLSSTPFGPASPYGKLAGMSHKLLLIGANAGGLVYHILDRAGFPNLYTGTSVRFELMDAKGQPRSILTPVPRADVPHVVILPGSRPENRDYMLAQDYALMFPARRESAVMEAGYLRYNRSRFLGRRERLRARGILRTGRVGRAEAALLDGARLIDQVVEDLRWDIARFKEEYDPEQLALLNLPAI